MRKAEQGIKKTGWVQVGLREVGLQGLGFMFFGSRMF